MSGPHDEPFVATVIEAGTPWPSPRRLAVVGCGGVVGAAGRWGVSELFIGPSLDVAGWSWATLVINLLGCLLIGFAARRVVRGSLSWDGLVTGVLCGFTTMSAFAVQLNELADAGRTSMLVGYLAATLVGGVGAIWLASSAPTGELRR